MAKKTLRASIVREAAKRFRFFVDGGDSDVSAAEKALEGAIGMAKSMGWYEGPAVRAIDVDMGMPEFTGRRGARPKYPFWRMEVGDAVEIEGSHLMDVQAAARSYGHRHGKKFLVQGERGVLLVAVKRVA